MNYDYGRQQVDPGETLVGVAHPGNHHEFRRAAIFTLLQANSPGQKVEFADGRFEAILTATHTNVFDVVIVSVLAQCRLQVAGLGLVVVVDGYPGQGLAL